MKGTVVDISVIMEAIGGKKPDSAPAMAEAQSMFKLLGSNNTVFANAAITKKCQDISRVVGERSRPQDCNDTVHKTLMRELANSERTSCADGTRVDRPGLKKCDREFVGVALQSGSVLVTDDARLSRLVADHPLGSGITCVTAEDALDMLDA